MSYATYKRGLTLLVEGTPATRGEYELAKRTLASLHSDTMSAGRNTWRASQDRYQKARERFNAFPSPCEVVLYNVAERCQRLGPKGYCEQCAETVKTVMHRTCDDYGIVLN